MYKLFIIFLLIILIPPVSAQNDQGFIYGTITTIEGKEYTGCIRWDDEEVFWTDFFNSHKSTYKYKDYNKNEKSYQSFMHWFMDDDNERSKDEHDHKHKTMGKTNLVHVWVCQFGDISLLEVTGREEVRLTLKDGTKIDLEGGSNDINTSVKLLDKDIGELSINWDKIEKVQFTPTPSHLPQKFGEPLYGTVTTSEGSSFTGLVQWDHDERLTTDMLDGDTEDGDLSIEFGNIKALIKKTNGTNVRLKSGREILLDGSNDVDERNRGIIVTIKSMGRVDISWDEFVMVKFENVPSGILSHYTDFDNPGKLKGTVRTKDGKIFKGTIVYDLDEELDLEMIQGRNNSLEYSIPLKNIAALSPKNYNYTTITLKNGNDLLLGESHDVADINSGLLVFTGAGEEPRYVSWDEMKTIEFE